MKKALSVLLVALLLTSTFLFAVPASAATTYKTGDLIQFGTYPQTRVEETTALKNAANAATWKSYGYYTGSGICDGQMKPGDWMQFADFFFGGEKVRAVKFTQYRPDRTCSFESDNWHGTQYANGYYINTVYYFRYEPLTWRVLDPSSGLIVCNNVVDAQAYQNTVYNTLSDGSEYFGTWQDSTQSKYASDYASSSIREWLNYDFYETAFTVAQKNTIKTTSLNNDSAIFSDNKYNSEKTYDKVFLLSYSEAKNSNYDFLLSLYQDDNYYIANSPSWQGTDYARCQGFCWGGQRSAGCWLRSPASDGWACFVTNGMDISWVGVEDIEGIRPACSLSLLKDDATISTSLFSGNSGNHPYESETANNKRDERERNFFKRIIEWFRNIFARLFRK